jgi:hypothetical protein
LSLEPIQRQNFADPDRMRAQDEAIASAKTNTEQHIAAYQADSRSFGGRYIAADLFKETFASFAASKEARNVYNTPVHNAAAVLSSEQFRRVVEQPDDPARDTVIFLTGIPGAGKTSTVIGAGGIDPAAKVVFEGQLVRPETTIPKIQQVIDAGLFPVIVAVHAIPEDALRNTLKRFHEEGRGASIGTMATIAGGLPDGLAAVRAHFGDAVKLNVFDYRDRQNPRQLIGWDNLETLRSEGNREDIAARLKAELERINSTGNLSEAAYRQAAGQAPLRIDASLDRSGADQREADARGRGLPQDDRAKAFLTLPATEAVKAHPELATAYASIDAIKRQLEASGLDDKQQGVVLDHARHAAASRIAKNDIPSVDVKEVRGADRSAGPER